MVGEMKRPTLEELLSEKQILHILKQAIGEDERWVIKGTEIAPAMDGIAGFVGDHMKAEIHVEVLGELKKVHLFIKCVPINNKPKADFIHEKGFFKRETLMYKVLDEVCGDDPNPWGAKAYICNDTIIVMPNLTVEGYAPQHHMDTLDTEHVFVTLNTVARYHASYINYETNKSISLNRPYNTYEEHSHILQDSIFCDCPFVKACTKLSMSLLKNFSTKPYRNMPDLESKLRKLHLEACDSLTEYKETVNVLLHKDLWVNNIMFKHEDGVPINAVLVDYQCLRYGPPAFDIMMFLYLTTSRQFRDEKESDVFDYYYSVFSKHVNEDSKKRLKELGYDKEDFLRWCEKGRMFGMFIAIAIFPFTLMEPKTAAKTFDDPETYEKYIHEDRSEPVIGHSKCCEVYKVRNLEATEEFIERYVL